MRKLIFLVILAFVLSICPGQNAVMAEDGGHPWEGSVSMLILIEIYDIANDHTLSPEQKIEQITILASKITLLLRIGRIQQELSDPSITEERAERLRAKLIELQILKKE